MKFICVGPWAPTIRALGISTRRQNEGPDGPLRRRPPHHRIKLPRPLPPSVGDPSTQKRYLTSGISVAHRRSRSASVWKSYIAAPARSGTETALIVFRRLAHRGRLRRYGSRRGAAKTEAVIMIRRKTIVRCLFLSTASCERTQQESAGSIRFYEYGFIDTICGVRGSRGVVRGPMVRGPLRLGASGHWPRRTPPDQTCDR